MSLYTILTQNVDAELAEIDQFSATSALERGQVLFLPSLSFAVQKSEASLFTPTILGGAKNASFDHRSGRLGGTRLTGSNAETLAGFMSRFSVAAARLTDHMFPAYRGRLIPGRASFRPAEVAGRVT